MPYERNGKLRQDTDKTNRLRIGRTNGNVETKLQNKDWRFKNIEGPNQKTWKENLESSSDFLSLFISDKGVRSGQDTQPNIRSDTVMDQIKVSEILADQFATIADGIGRTDVDLWFHLWFHLWFYTSLLLLPMGLDDHMRTYWFHQSSKCEVDRAEIKRFWEVWFSGSKFDSGEKSTGVSACK